MPSRAELLDNMFVQGIILAEFVWINIMVIFILYSGKRK